MWDNIELSKVQVTRTLEGEKKDLEAEKNIFLKIMCKYLCERPIIMLSFSKSKLTVVETKEKLTGSLPESSSS